MTLEYDLVPPRASAIAESLRAVGYNVQTAIADIVDNSLTAEARNVWVDFHWDGVDSHVVIVDDGNGMGEAAICNAMRLGSRSPLDSRDKSDLGRFGLGLKTASFSQARRLTVASRFDGGEIRSRCWDLATIDDQWKLLRVAIPAAAARLHELRSGTAVVWELVDRLVTDSSSRAHDHFLQQVERVKWHLATFFHRFMSGRNALKIHLNGRPLEALDPFLEDEPATQMLPEERLSDDIVLRPFILPHHLKISHDVYTQAAGPDGWNSRQGFYIYRSRRLLVAGDWLGLGFSKDEHTKLVRIQLDLTTNQDHEWNIDIKKSRSRPPAHLRDSLCRIAKICRERGVEVFRHRGRQLSRDASDKSLFVWQQQGKHGRVSYRINREHPLVRAVRDHLPSAKPLSAMLTLIEEALPVSMIILDQSERPDSQMLPFEEVAGAETEHVIREMVACLVASGVSRDDAFKRLLGMTMFARCEGIVKKLREEIPL